jgi:rhodanese-related sulfurtransferase
MRARLDCFRLWKSRFGNSPDALFIDGRLAMEEYQILCIPGGDTGRQDTYEKEWLFSGEEAEETVCSLKQTSFMAGAIAAMMVNIAVNYFTNVALGAPIRDVPFFTSYSGSCVYLKTE